MALKIISGLLLPTAGDRSIGSVTVSLTDGKIISGSDARFTDVRIIGSGNYVGEPCQQISLRHIVFSETDKAGILSKVFDPQQHLSFNINDEFVVEDGVAKALKISWVAGPRGDDSAHRSEIVEISVLVIGETK